MIFNTACKNGKFNMAKYLFKKFPDIIITEQLLKYVCFNNHLYIVNWILKIKPNIDITYNNDCIFNGICIRNLINIVKLFIKIKPNRYYVLIKNNLIIKSNVIDSIYIDTILNCPICQDTLANVITDCKHQFCKLCLNLWLDENNSCPYCRSNINGYNIIKVN